jgi:hypothetical protein
VNALFALQNANASQSGTIQVLQDANHRFRAHITSLESENERLQLAIRAHEMETCRNNEIAEDLLPFVRDQQGVALRTLVDGVLYAAGWNGDDWRETFMLHNSARLVVMFGNRFTEAEISAIVL